MPDKPSNLGQFWQELKRRKVVRVITVYAAASFVILELTDIVAPSLGLPEWTLNFIIILLFVGFIITVISSWIYDVTPEGIEKTKPAHKVKEEDKSVTSNSWKIASYISFVVIVALIVFHIVSTSNRSKEIAILEKSIAVLPFINDSSDEENVHFINGTMEAILDNLCKIEDLRVVSRTSVEQYRDNPKPMPDIAREMNVSYILEGSGQKDGDDIRLTIQLLDAVNDKHVWSNPYTREIKIGEIFSIQSEIAQLVAAEIEAFITPEEKQLIEKVPTTDLTAYDFYQRGREEHIKYWLDWNKREALERAEYLYHEALEYDSTFAQAYTGLAQVYREKHFWETFLTEQFLDSVLILADIALSFDDQLAEAYVVRGEYYRANYEKELAINEYDKAIKFNPNDWQAYNGKGWLYFNDDLLKTIDNFQKAASLQRGPLLPRLYKDIGRAYALAGFKERACYYAKEVLKLDDDSASYYRYLASNEEYNGNYEKAIEYGEKSYTIDSTNLGVIIFLGLHHSFLDQFEEYLEYYKKFDKRVKNFDLSNTGWIFRIGHAYWINGFKEKAEYYFNIDLEFLDKQSELGRHPYQDLHTFYWRACIYAFLGDRDKAFENLRVVNQRERMPIWIIPNTKHDPLFDSIRDEPEFQQIVEDMEAKYQAEHERVRKWLEEQGIL